MIIFSKYKFLLILILVAVFLALGNPYLKPHNKIFSQAFATNDVDNFVKISGFYSAQKAEYFYHNLPKKYLKNVRKAPTNSYRSSKKPFEYYLKISLKNQSSSQEICDLVEDKSLKCPTFEKPNFKNKKQFKNPRSYKFSGKSKTPLEFKTTGVQSIIDKKTKVTDEIFIRQQNLPEFEDLEIIGSDKIEDDLSSDFSKFEQPDEKYEEIKNKIALQIKQSGGKINQSQDLNSANQSLMNLGIEGASNYGSDYVFKSLEKRKSVDIPDSDNSFLKKVKTNFFANSKNTIKSFFSGFVKGKTSKGAEDKELVSKKTDELSIGSAKSVVDAGISAAKKSDIYFLRNLELEYKLRVLTS
ncbi:MAG: hypothetical protein ACJA0S_000378 [Rickettsiales bacterium]|jgi:hypothetical protein